MSTSAACDLGIVGKDTIMEHGGSFYVLIDLGYGKCRFALAGCPRAVTSTAPTGAGWWRPKYPSVTKSYFERKGMDVSVIKIEGSVELAPLVGLPTALWTLFRRAPH